MNTLEFRMLLGVLSVLIILIVGGVPVMKSVLRFLFGIVPAILLLIVSMLFPKSKMGEFCITRGHVQRLAFWIIGIQVDA